MNFNTDMLVCIALGQRNSGGYSVSVQKVQKADPGTITVSYVEKRPNPRMRVTMAITSPYVIVKMKQRPETIAFSGEIMETQGFVDPFEPSDNYGTSDRVQWGLYLTGTYCNIEEPRTDVITSVSEFRKLWTSLNGQDNIPRDVDFGESQLICISLGKRPTSGYSVYVQSVTKPSKNNIVVTYTEKRPGPRDRVADQVSSPFVILKIPRSDARVTFKPQSEDSKGNDQYRNRERNPIGMAEDAVFYRNYTFGAVSKITTAQTRVITSASEFAAYWKELTGSSDRPRDINFDNEQLVAIHLGSKPSSGYSVAVTSVVKPVSNQIVISYIERRPRPQDKVEGETLQSLCGHPNAKNERQDRGSSRRLLMGAKRETRREPAIMIGQVHANVREKSPKIWMTSASTSDNLDDQIVEALNRRASLAAEVGLLKGRDQKPFFTPEREREIFEKLSNINSGPLQRRQLISIYREIISACESH